MPDQPVGVYHVIEPELPAHASREGRPHIDQFGPHRDNTVLIAYGYVGQDRQDAMRIQAVHPSRVKKFEELAEKQGFVNNGPAGLRHLSPPQVDYPFQQGVTYFDWEPLQVNPNTDVRGNQVLGAHHQKRHNEAGIFRTARMNDKGEMVTSAEYRGSWDDVTRHIQQKVSEGYKFVGSTEERSPAVTAAIWQEHQRQKDKEVFHDIEVPPLEVGRG
ncbi:MAG: hypothetical protein GC134_07880 [Proteobacteria bacterium]|nr:hypothetical protein [Pseudomonadota bacterium]